ncbi:MAG: translation elongation factor Ts [Candidatus Brocadiia bacterium]
MSISAQQVKELRERTGAGLMDCKRALVEAEGDAEQARTILRERGLAKAEKKRGRETSEGIIASYVHSNERLGVLVELACETDFVARSDEFKQLGKEMAMQVAASNPLALIPDELPEETVEAEREVYRKQHEDKPENIQEQIIEGKLGKFYDENCLLRQPYIRDDSLTVEEFLKQAIAKLGENIELRRFVRMEVGG